MPNQIESYLAALRRELRVKPCFVERIMAEIEDHLLEGAVREEQRGASPDEAERIVIERFGSAEVVARWWSEVYASENGASTMWQRFTERARRVVFFAQEEAARFGGNLVDTEHLLLGLVREEDSAACRILTRLGTPAGAVRTETEARVTRVQGDLSRATELTSKAKRVIDLAYEEARLLDNNYIGSEHLLVAIIREGDGLGARVLESLGIDLQRARAEVHGMQEGEALATTEAAVVPISPDPSVIALTFTERARRLVSDAQEEAVRLGENYVGTEHLLLGLLRQTDSVAARVLDGLSVPLGRIRSEIERQVTRGHGNLGQDMLLTPPAKRVVQWALDEAHRLKSEELGTEHLLLGLIREGDGLAARVLVRLGANLERTRSVIESLQEGGAGTATGESAPPPLGSEPSAAPKAPVSATEQSSVTGMGPADAAAAMAALLGSGAVSPIFPPWLRWSAAPPSAPSVIRWEQLDERARRALFLAYEEALRLGSNRVYPNALLLGLAREDSLATRILERVGISTVRLRAEVEQISPPELGLSHEMSQMAPESIAIVERAWEEAQALNHDYLGTEHLLLGVLRLEELPASKILVRLGLSLERVREEIPVVGARWAAIVQARRRLEEAEAAYRALFVGT
jgi:ATP-dependent Clp protease ATP-binding subunit ClpA